MKVKKIISSKSSLLAGLLLSVIHSANAGSFQVEASIQQNTGCAFTSSSDGALGLSSNFMELSTETAGGKRPSLTISVMGTATLTLSQRVVWSRDQTVLPEVSTQVLQVHRHLTSQIVLNMPHRIFQTGTYTFYLQATGVSPNGFFQSGHYKAKAVFDCL